MNNFWDFNVGNVITIAGLIFAFWKFSHANKDRIQRRHEENLTAMAHLTEKIIHFDICIDEMKQELISIRERFMWRRG